jgi:alanine racemase
VHRCASAEIDLDAFRHNVAVARRHAGARAVWCVIKADAYGHGMVELARAVPDAAGFCVVDLDEALALRAAGITQPVAVLHGAHTADAVREAAARGLTLGVHDPAQVELLENAADAVRDGLAGCWLKLDVGMHRLGVPPEAAPALRARLARLVGEDRVATMMHFACADTPDHPLTDRQLAAFRAALPGTGPVTACNSAALFAPLDVPDTIVRPGIALYGGSPRPASVAAADLDLRPVMTLRSRLIAVKEIPEGGTVGYGATWTARRPTRLGLVAVGYGDGYPRHVPSGTPVRIGDGEVPTAGRVSMDSIAVDLTDRPDVRRGDEAVLWGAGLDVDRIADAAGTIALEVLARVTPRVPRRWLGTEEAG